MRFLNTADLQAVLPSAWGARTDDDTRLIREVARRYPGYTRRIHDIAYLTRPVFALAGWIYEDLSDEALKQARTQIGEDIRPGRPIDMLGAGEDGLRQLDAAMVGAFRAVAPRDVFDLPGRVTDRAGEGEVILRLLQDRDDSFGAGLGEIHDPMRFDRLTVRSAGNRLARAVAAYLGAEDRPVARRVLQVALGEKQDVEIRRAAVEASSWLIGYPEVLDAIAACRGDLALAVRLEAVRALAPRADQIEVAAEIATFLDDRDEAVRRAAITAFVGRKLAHGTTLLLMNSVFDRDREVSRLAQLVVPESEIIHNLRRIASDLETGRSVELHEMRTLAASDYLSDEEKDRGFVGWIGRLRASGGDSLGDAAILVRVLTLDWTGGHTEGFWRAMASFEEMLACESLRGDLIRLLQKTGDSADAWVLIEALLRSPLSARDGNVAGLVDTAVQLGRRAPRVVMDLVRCAMDRSMSEDNRLIIVGGLREIGPARPVAEAIAVMFMDPYESPRVAKQALVSVIAMVGEEARTAFLRQALESPQQVVRNYAESALEVLAPGRPQVEPRPAEEAKVLDLAEARRRRAAAHVENAKDES